MHTFQSARRHNSPERGSTIVVALIVLSALLMAGTITIVKVQRGTRASSQARFQSIALFAAESGIASGMEFLRTNVDPIAYFGAFISPNNSSVQTPPGIAGNSMAYLDPGNVFSGDTEMSYEVSVLNNAEDPGFAVGDDTDAVVTLRSVGKGPGTSSVVLEVSVDASSSGPLQIIRWRVIE